MTNTITLNLTLEELKTLEKYMEHNDNDETRPLFDKIKNAYPKPETLLDVIRNLGYSYDCCYEIVDAVEKFEKSKEPEENEWKSVALRFGETLSGYLSDGYYELSPAAWFRWAVFTYGKGQQVKEVVRENLKWFEENPEKSVEDYLKPYTPEKTEKLQEKNWYVDTKTNLKPHWEPKPQTPEQVADGLKEAFREAVKQGIVSSVDEPTKPMNEVLDRLENKYENDDVVNRMLKKWEENPPDFLRFELSKSLEALITRWWDDVYDGIHQDWDREVAIDDLIDQIQLWLPKSQSHEGTQSASVIDLVDGYNDALTKIKSKLRNKK